MDELTVIIIAIVIFLVLREFWTWYWKINALIKGQEETNELLRAIIRMQQNDDNYQDYKQTNMGTTKAISKPDIPQKNYDKTWGALLLITGTGLLIMYALYNVIIYFIIGSLVALAGLGLLIIGFVTKKK